MKRDKLFELFRDSKEPSFMKFLESLEKDGVIYAEEIFKEKVRQDKWWEEALERNNKLNNVEEDDE